MEYQTAPWEIRWRRTRDVLSQVRAGSVARFRGPRARSRLTYKRIVRTFVRRRFTAGEVGGALGHCSGARMRTARGDDERAKQAAQGQQALFQPTPTSRFLHPERRLTRLRAA